MAISPKIGSKRPMASANVEPSSTCRWTSLSTVFSPACDDLFLNHFQRPQQRHAAAEQIG